MMLSTELKLYYGELWTAETEDEVGGKQGIFDTLLGFLDRLDEVGTKEDYSLLYRIVDMAVDTGFFELEEFIGLLVDWKVARRAKGLSR